MRRQESNCRQANIVLTGSFSFRIVFQTFHHPLSPVVGLIHARWVGWLAGHTYEVSASRWLPLLLGFLVWAAFAAVTE
ncbi:MAG: hypothetical protein CMJ66_08355 [Planctomycetaceae bacterium]|nr:hypothetical protein [Planctomycetaceae bacterium]